MRIFGLTPRAFRFGLVFTIVETIVLVAWLILAGLPFKLSLMHIIAVVVLFVGLLVEHTLSLLAGKYNTF